MPALSGNARSQTMTSSMKSRSASRSGLVDEKHLKVNQLADDLEEMGYTRDEKK